MKIPIKIRKIYDSVITPKYQTGGSVGFDVHAYIKNGLSQVVIPPNKQKIINTGLEFCLPEGWELQIRPRSGLAAKYSLTITNSPGSLDSDYRNELMIILFNLGEDNIIINHNDRIAQCILSPIYQAEFVEVENFSKDDMEKDRGGGLGSTGIK